MAKRIISASIRYLFTGILLALFCWSPLWSLDPYKAVDQYLVDQWGATEGIPSNTIIAIVQTPDGYLWLRTDKALVRFDGVKFSPVPFLPKNKISPPDALYVDRDGTLWIGSAEGLTSYQYKTGQFKTFTTTDGLTGDHIRLIREDMNGDLWISFESSYVNRFSNGKFTLFDESHGLAGKKINAIVEDKNGTLLFATHENGVFKYKSGKFSKYPVKGIDYFLVICMHLDRQGNLWIGSTNGLFNISDKGTERYTTMNGLSNNRIADIREDSEGNIWIGSEEGLNRIHKTQNGKVGFDSLLKSLKILCLFEDKEKNLWIGTLDSGIKRLKDGKFKSYAPLEEYPEETLSSLFQNRLGDIWIGTVSGKLFHCRGGKLIETMENPELSGTGIAAIGADAEGNLWLGTTGKGIYTMKKNTLVQFTSNEGLADNLVTSIYRDSRNDLWFGTFDGVSVFRRPSGIIESFTAKGGLTGKRVHNVFEDKDRNIWIASDKGITVLKGGKITKQNKKYLTGFSVSCIYEDPSPSEDEGKVFWIATHGDGLKRLSLKDGTVTTYTTEQGMTTNFLYRFFEDQQGNFWLMSNSGVLRVSKSELNRFNRRDQDKIHCTSFGVSDGMKSSQFNNEFSRNSALNSQTGELWFITRKGISIVNPEKIGINKRPPPVVIEEAFFNQSSFPSHHRSSVEATKFKGKGEFRVRFTAPTFLSPEKVKFRYQLEGIDRDWIYLSHGTGRAVRYPNLSPGTYTFKVTACNAEGIWNRTGASITFTLEPFFYQTILFKIAVYLLFIGFVVAAFYIYKKRPFERKEKYKGSPLHADFAEECIKKLNHLMIDENMYRNAEISLRSLAEKLSIHPYQLSQILNEKLKRSFSDYINYHRIEEAKKILKSPKGETPKITSLAHEVGFNAMTAFYKAFKKFTGMTPTQYQEEVKKK